MLNVNNGKQTFQWSEIPFAKMLSHREIKCLKEYSIVIRKKQRELIHEQDNEELFIYFLLEGVVKLGQHFKNPYEMVIAYIPSNSFIGLDLLFDGKKKLAYAEAITEITYLKIRTKSIQNLMKKNADFSVLMFNHLQKQSLRTQLRLDMIYSRCEVRERVVKLLIEFAKDFGKKVGDEILIRFPITHTEMANIIFCSRQTISKLMNELRREGLIFYDRKIILIRSMDQLQGEL